MRFLVILLGAAVPTWQFQVVAFDLVPSPQRTLIFTGTLGLKPTTSICNSLDVSAMG